ncbi:MAG: 2Fe-2S iron-sulfur cluster binding domain-containing protein [Candidatus Woesearchaeota archaeon]
MFRNDKVQQMGQIEFEGQFVEINDGEAIQEACEELGIPFGCASGVCGVCTVKVLEGMDNLNPRTAEEDDLELEPNERLACRCQLKKGNLKISY